MISLFFDNLHNFGSLLIFEEKNLFKTMMRIAHRRLRLRKKYMPTVFWSPHSTSGATTSNGALGYQDLQVWRR